METTWKGRKSLYDTTATTSQSDSVTTFKCNSLNYGVTSEEVSSFNLRVYSTSLLSEIRLSAILPKFFFFF